MADRRSLRVVDVDPADPRVAAAVARYVADLGAVWGRTVPPPPAAAIASAAYRPPGGITLLALLDDRVVGTAALRPLPGSGTTGPATCEVKRMWVDGTVRGRGIGRRLLDHLHAAAAALGHDRVVLDTQADLVAARGLYTAAGYVEVARYNDNPDATHFYAREL